MMIITVLILIPMIVVLLLLPARLPPPPGTPRKMRGDPESGGPGDPGGGEAAPSIKLL